MKHNWELQIKYVLSFAEIYRTLNKKGGVLKLGLKSDHSGASPFDTDLLWIKSDLLPSKISLLNYTVQGTAYERRRLEGCPAFQIVMRNCLQTVLGHKSKHLQCWHQGHPSSFIPTINTQKEGYLLDLFIISMWWKWRDHCQWREQGEDGALRVDHQIYCYYERTASVSFCL